MPILSREQCEALLKKVLSYSKADECEVSIFGSDSGNIRFARNAASTSAAVTFTQLSVSATFGKRNGVTTINEYDDASLEKVVRRAEELARLAPENPEYVSILGPQEYKESQRFVDATAAIDPRWRADAISGVLQVAKEQTLTAAGFLENSAAYSAMANSKGLFAYSTATNVNFNVTMRTADAQGSGYGTKGFNDVSQLDIPAIAKRAAQKSAGSINARAIEPGKYTVILEPAAAIVLVENLALGMDARSTDEGRSFLSLPGGKSRLGEKLVDERVNMYSDPFNPLLPTSNYNQDGRPMERTSWIENGVVKNLSYDRYWAEKKGVKAVAPGHAFIMDGTHASLDELIQNTEKGLLITRLWYIRSVDPQTLLFTGLTRDGTFYIEDGAIKYPVKNLRFNESPVIMLNNLEALGKPERTVSGESGIHALVPPIKVRDFTFTSLSDAV